MYHTEGWHIRRVKKNSLAATLQELTVHRERQAVIEESHSEL